MGTRISYPPFFYQSQPAGPDERSFTVAANAPTETAQVDETIIDYAQYDKVEIEYSMWLPMLSKLQVGRVTVLYDGIGVQITSHEVEHSSNFGIIDTVEIAPYKSGNNIGISVLNQSEESFDFKYQVVNKFKIGAVIVEYSSPFSAALLDPTYTQLNSQDYQATYFNTVSSGNKGENYVDNQIVVANGGKFYFEVLKDSFDDINVTDGGSAIGLISTSVVPSIFANRNFATYFNQNYPDVTSIHLKNNGEIRSSDSNGIGNEDLVNTLVGGANGNGDVVGLALDLDNMKLWVAVNGVWKNGDPANNVGGENVASLITGSFVYFGVSRTLVQSQSFSATVVKEPVYRPDGFELV